LVKKSPPFVEHESHCRVKESSPLVAVLSQINPVHALICKETIYDKVRGKVGRDEIEVQGKTSKPCEFFPILPHC
jgi:hypothetical protein